MYSKKGFAGNIQALAGAGLALVVLIFVLTIGANLTQTVQDQYPSNTTVYNISHNGLMALDLFGDWFDIIILIIIAVMVIGLLMMLKFSGAN